VLLLITRLLLMAPVLQVLLVLLQWEGGGGVTVLAADGRDGQLALTPGQQPLLGVEIAEALGHAALGLCASVD